MFKMKKVIGNLKNYMTYEETLEYIDKVDERAIICPPTIFVSYFLNSKNKIGIQNVSMYDLGSHTGEVMATHAKQIGIEYAIIGHSERRDEQNEVDAVINKKVLKVLENNLKVILCIGENKDDDKELKLKTQLINALNGVSSLDDVIIAYEPVWCIGTGLTPTNEQIFDTTNYIKEIVEENFNSDIEVLYGGSVNKKNINILKNIENISGFLIGKAATDYNELNEIVDSL